MMLLFLVNKNSSNKLITMNALALVVFVLLFLTSTLVHADHLTDHSLSSEQQECYICHQGIDTPPELPQIRFHYVASYNLKLQKVTIVHGKVNDFMQPQLRAPPTFQ